MAAFRVKVRTVSLGRTRVSRGRTNTVIQRCMRVHSRRHLPEVVPLATPPVATASGCVVARLQRALSLVLDLAHRPRSGRPVGFSHRRGVSRMQPGGSDTASFANGPCLSPAAPVAQLGLEPAWQQARLRRTPQLQQKLVLALELRPARRVEPRRQQRPQLQLQLELGLVLLLLRRLALTPILGLRPQTWQQPMAQPQPPQTQTRS